MLYFNHLPRGLRLLVLFLSIIQLHSSCITTKPPNFEYFHSEYPFYPDTVRTAIPRISVIQKGDILGIIISSLNKESNEILNFPNVNSLPVTAFSGGSVGVGSQPLGFPVDSSGSIHMPIVGQQKVEGLTLELAEQKIRQTLNQTLKDPTVNIRFMNHKYTVLGEVGQVGTFNLLDDQTTILDVLAASGDLTPFAKRDSIMIIRQIKGGRQIGRLNLRSRAAFRSPYFYIQNGDVLYVEPTRAKDFPAKVLSPFWQRAPVFLGVITSFTTLLFIVFRR